MDARINIRMKGDNGEIDMTFEHQRGGLPAKDSLDAAMVEAFKAYRELAVPPTVITGAKT